MRWPIDAAITMSKHIPDMDKAKTRSVLRHLCRAMSLSMRDLEQLALAIELVRDNEVLRREDSATDVENGFLATEEGKAFGDALKAILEEEGSSCKAERQTHATA